MSRDKSLKSRRPQTNSQKNKKSSLPPLEEPLTILTSLENLSRNPIFDSEGQNKDSSQPLVSYCTTTFNRFWQLKQVVKHNLTIINQSQPAEWIIVDFGGRDSQEMSDWLKENCPRSLKRGTLKYYRRHPDLSEFKWNVSQAKNVSHRLATGQILINLDGDNFIQKQDPDIVRSFFQKNPNLLLHQTWNNFLIQYNLRSSGRNRNITYREFLPNFSGSNGRISMVRQHFMDLGGYDEEMLFMGFQDTDLLTRGVLAGLNYQAKEPIQDWQPNQKLQKSNRITRSTGSLITSSTGRVLRIANRTKSNATPIPSTSPFIPESSTLRSSNFRSLLRAPPTPFKGESADSISNQRSRPYKNNQVKSWKEAENRNRILSQRKIRQGQLKVNLEGFLIPLTDYQRQHTPEAELKAEPEAEPEAELKAEPKAESEIESEA